jgi:hypothetical protein
MRNNFTKWYVIAPHIQKSWSHFKTGHYNLRGGGGGEGAGEIG